MGFVSSNELTRLFQNAKGFIFPQAEDFGITPVEAQYFGCPVIAYGKGGALETVIKEKTGIFFDQQTEESLNQAISVFEKTKFDYQAIHEHAYQFNANNFIQKINEFVDSHSLQ